LPHKAHCTVGHGRFTTPRLIDATETDAGHCKSRTLAVTWESHMANGLTVNDGSTVSETKEE
jgi:hypothetical protein